MGDKGLIFTPVLVRHLLVPLGLFGPTTNTSWTHTYFKQSHWKVPCMVKFWWGKFWQIVQVKAFGKEKFGEYKLQSVHMPNTCLMYLCILTKKILANSSQFDKFTLSIFSCVWYNPHLAVHPLLAAHPPPPLSHPSPPLPQPTPSHPTCPLPFTRNL